MKTLHFSTKIDATPETVWKTMLDEDGFRQWSAEFAAGSYYEGSWDKDATIRFLTPEGNGMISTISENRPYTLISIKHIGFVAHGVDDTESPEVRTWAPAYENYIFRDLNGATLLQVDMDVLPEFEGFMEKTWPNALATLKAMCE